MVASPEAAVLGRQLTMTCWGPLSERPILSVKITIWACICLSDVVELSVSWQHLTLAAGAANRWRAYAYFSISAGLGPALSKGRGGCHASVHAPSTTTQHPYHSVSPSSCSSWLSSVHPLSVSIWTQLSQQYQLFTPSFKEVLPVITI
jgi:hypothetical protein